MHITVMIIAHLKGYVLELRQVKNEYHMLFSSPNSRISFSSSISLIMICNSMLCSLHIFCFHRSLVTIIDDIYNVP